MTELKIHQEYMQRCLQLAALGLGNVAPNPQVGCVLAFQNRIIGEGYHQRYGEAHAEVNCINAVAEEDRKYLEKATLYVSLEPCCHYGQTPPCVDLILESGIKRVVIGCKDFSAKIDGRGIQILKENGVEVIENILEKECIEINKRFFYFELQKMPFVILKWAESADGFIGRKNHSLKISNELSDRLVHRWRADEAAILVGYQTAIQDNPKLNVRLAKGANPLRIVFDKDLSLPTSLNLFDQTLPTLVFNFKESKSEGLVEFVKISAKNVIEQMLHFLWEKKVGSLLVEGGSHTIQDFVNANLWNEARVIRSDQILFEGIARPQLHNALVTDEFRLKNDSITILKNQPNK